MPSAPPACLKPACLKSVSKCAKARIPVAPPDLPFRIYFMGGRVGVWAGADAPKTLFETDSQLLRMTVRLLAALLLPMSMRYWPDARGVTAQTGA